MSADRVGHAYPRRPARLGFKPRFLSALLGPVMALGLVLGSAAAGAVPAGAVVPEVAQGSSSTSTPHGILPPGHPVASIGPVPDFLGPCARTAGALDGRCGTEALRALDRARALESLPDLPIDLGRFRRLDLAEQLLALVDLERQSRGLAVLAGLDTELDVLAASAAAANSDPSLPPGPPTLPGGARVLNWSGNLAIGTVNSLVTSYDLMYEDGPGPINLACSSATTSRCWGHRFNILARYPDQPRPCRRGSRAWRLMGAAKAVDGGIPAVGELMVAACGTGPPPVAVSWWAVARYLSGAGPLPPRAGTG